MSNRCHWLLKPVIQTNECKSGSYKLKGIRLIYMSTMFKVEGVMYENHHPHKFPVFTKR